MSSSAAEPRANASAAATHAPFVEASPKQVRAWMLAGQAVLVDVREPDEYARERIDGAHLVPLSRFDAASAAALAKPGQRLVMQCRTGRRSADACRLAASGVGGVGGVMLANLTGGIEAWKREQLPVTIDRRAPAISVMRQVQIVIGTAVLGGSALAWFVHPVFMGVPAFFGAGLVFAGATGTCALASLISRLPWNRGCANCP